MIDLPSQTVLIVGVGGAGSEASKLCAAFGMRVLGADPRATELPVGMTDLFTPERLEERLGEADFVIVTTPETPETLGMFNARLFSRMKRGAYFINISRGGCVVTEDLIAALRSGHLAGAGLDVVDPEPLPPDSLLWEMPNVLITPHVGILFLHRLPKGIAVHKHLTRLADSVRVQTPEAALADLRPPAEEATAQNIQPNFLRPPPAGARRRPTPICRARVHP